MRDPNRLDNIYTTILQFHKTTMPDVRIGQLFINFERWCKLVKNVHDIIYIEDEEVLLDFKEYSNDITYEVQ